MKGGYKNLGLKKLVSRFVVQRMAMSECFTMADLLAFVRHHVPEVSPESTSRSLRRLRQLGRINYTVRDRHAGKFQALPDQVVGQAMGASN